MSSPARRLTTPWRLPTAAAPAVSGDMERRLVAGLRGSAEKAVRRWLSRIATQMYDAG